MNQKRRLGRFKAATGRYDQDRAMHIAKHQARAGKNIANVTVGSKSLQAETAAPRNRRRVTTVTAR